MWKNLWKSLHPSFIFLGFIIGIILGTILGIIFRISCFSSPLWVVFILILFIFSLEKANRFFLGVAVFAGMIFGGFRVSVEMVGQNQTRRFFGETVELTGTVSGDPDEDESVMKIKLREVEIEGEKVGGEIYINMGSGNRIRRGDRITISGKLSEGFGIFTATMYRPKVLAISEPEPRDGFLEIRDWFSSGVKKYIPEEEASLGLAYLLGMKTGLSSELVEILTVVGLTHIVVASGTHLGIIVEAVKKIFGKISRFSGLFFSLILIFGFGSMVGWTASITRAAIVTGLSLLSWYYGRKFNATRLILISMATTLLIDPMFLVNLGWQLSFGAFIGILVLAPRMKRFFYGRRKPNKIVDILFTTIAASLMCAPILLYYFGMISLISLVANVLILPTMAMTMGMVFFTGVVSFWPFLATIVAKITTFILDYHLFVMRFFGAQKIFLIKIEAGNPWIFLLYLPILAPLIVGAVKRFLIRRQRGLYCYA